MKVLFIAGAGRSGSTILGTLLGQLDGFLSVGELRYLWDRGILGNLRCGCEKDFRTCPLWSEAARKFLKAPDETIKEIVELRDHFRTRDCLWHMSRRGRENLQKGLADYATSLREVYLSLQETTNCRIIVDSSKFPSHGYVIDLIDEVDLYVVHLIRDPRAVAFSWRREKVYDLKESQSELLPRHSLAASALRWLVWNAIVEYLWGSRTGRYFRIRYEDFVLNPIRSIEQLRDFVSEESDIDFFSDSRTANVTPTHEVSGNPSRFTKDTVRISEDQEWSNAMKPWEKRWIETISWPLMLRYGYLQNHDKDESLS